MTQHPFDREFSEQEAAKLNAEQQTNANDELTDEETQQVAGGLRIITDGINEGGITKAVWETGGGASKPFVEAGTTNAVGEEGGITTD